MSPQEYRMKLLGQEKTGYQAQTGKERNYAAVKTELLHGCQEKRRKNEMLHIVEEGKNTYSGGRTALMGLGRSFALKRRKTQRTAFIYRRTAPLSPGPGAQRSLWIT